MLTEPVAPDATPTARPQYIPHQGRFLFAWHHPAHPGVRRSAAVVLCPPLGSDYICVYRPWRMLAERLAAMGFDVLRFDYEGTGDSAGDPEEPGRLEAWIGNIECVVKEAKKLAGTSNVALVGLRIGATLALQAAVAQGGVDRLVLWSPFGSGRAYVRELKAFSRISRRDYVTKIDEGSDILAAGYVLPGAIARALEGLHIDTVSIRPALEVLLVDRDDRSPDPAIGERLESLGARVTRIRPPGTAEMLERPAMATAPDPALDAIGEWLGGWPSPSRAAAHVSATPRDNRHLGQGADFCERAIRFGPDERLFGILTTPTATDDAAPVVILLNTGFEYRVGPHRLYVPLARELASQGHHVLRYDLGGIGDSVPPPGAAWNIPYPAHALEDAREAIEFTRKQAPGRRLIVAGLCSGGWHSFCAAREGLRVDAIMSINAPLYLRDGAAQLARRAMEYQEMLRYRRMLRDRARWARALRGRSKYLYFIRFAATYLGRKMTDIVWPVLDSRLMDGLGRDLDAINARGITSLFVFSEGDAGLEYFRRHARPGLGRWKTRERVHLKVVEGAGHTFSPPEAQHTLRKLLVEFVSRQTFDDPAPRETRTQVQSLATTHRAR